MTIRWKAVDQHFTVMFVFKFSFTQLVILKKISIIVLALGHLVSK